MLSSERLRPAAERYLLSPISTLIDRTLSSRVDPSATVVLTGFWRSGTTWILQSLGAALPAKTVFEPLDPRAIAGQGRGPYRGALARSLPVSHAFMPFSEASAQAPAELVHYLSLALTSALRGYWVRGARGGIGESFRRRVVLKTVRGQLCLTALHQAFHVPLVHVTRDPRGVAASIRRGGWWRGWLDSISLADLLIHPEDGRALYFSHWHDEIVDFDSRGPLEKAIAYWALTERYVRHCEHDLGIPLTRLFYDTLSEGLPTSLTPLLDPTSPPPSSGPRSSAGPTTSEKRRSLSFEERARGWKKELSRSEAGSIEAIARLFGLEDTLVP